MNMRCATLFLAILALGCERAPTSPNVVHGAVVLVSDMNAGGWPPGSVTIDSLTSSFGGPLRAYVTYGGGCRVHRIALLVETAFAESNPPVLRARLTHDDSGGDPCDALITTFVEFDLDPVRAHFSASYPAATGVLALDVVGAPRVTYSFP